MQKPLEDWHGKPNSLKASALRHWLVESMSTVLSWCTEQSYSFNFSIPLMPSLRGSGRI